MSDGHDHAARVSLLRGQTKAREAVGVVARGDVDEDADDRTEDESDEDLGVERHARDGSLGRLKGQALRPKG